MRDIDVSATTSAAPTAVWRLLGDSATWPSWTPIDIHRQVSPGGPDGVGEIREFRTGRRLVVREQIVERRPPQRLRYVLLSGLAVKDYRADIDLHAEPDGGTRIRWHTTFTAKVPGTGWLYRRALLRATARFVDGLVRASVGGPRKPSGDAG